MAKRRYNNEGSIYRDRDGFRAQISIHGKRLSFSARTHQECRAWLKQMKAQIDEGLTYRGSQFTLSEFLTTWLGNKKGSMRPGPWGQYNRAVEKYINPPLGKIKLQELRPDQIQRFYTRLQDQDIGVPTIRKIHTVLRSALSQAEKMSLITRNPAKAVIVPNAPTKEMRILDDRQVNQFIITLMGHRWEALFHLALATGMRQMELLGLKWSDVDWVNNKIRVERQLERNLNKGIRFAPTKTKAGKRTIKLGLHTMKILQNHYENQHSLRQEAAEKWCEYDLIFTTNIGTPINHSNLRRDFKMLLSEAGLPAIRFHDLRHTAASLMLNNDIHYKAVSERLGHARPSITLDIYSHVDSAMQDKAAEVIDELLTPVALPKAARKLHANCTQNRESQTRKRHHNESTHKYGGP